MVLLIGIHNFVPTDKTLFMVRTMKFSYHSKFLIYLNFSRIGLLNSFLLSSQPHSLCIRFISGVFC